MSVKTLSAAIAFALAAYSAPVLAQDGLAGLQIVECRTHDTAQEKADMDLALETLEIMQTHDQARLNKILPEVKAALNHAPDVPSHPEKCGDTIVVYSDHMEDMLVMSALISSADNTTGATRVEQRPAPPYPLLAFIVGWIEYENHDYQAAHDAYAKGLKNDPDYHSLVMEDSLALAFLGRSAEALVQLDGYLARNSDLNDTQMAAAQRKRGYLLVELGRWEEAEKAYKDSLVLEPGNSIARGELDYIRKNRKR